MFYGVYKVLSRLYRPDNLFYSTGYVLGYHVLHKREPYRRCRPEDCLGRSFREVNGINVRQQVDCFLDRMGKQAVLSIRWIGGVILLTVHDGSINWPGFKPRHTTKHTESTSDHLYNGLELCVKVIKERRQSAICQELLKSCGQQRDYLKPTISVTFAFNRQKTRRTMSQPTWALMSSKNIEIVFPCSMSVRKELRPAVWGLAAVRRLRRQKRSAHLVCDQL